MINVITYDYDNRKCIDNPCDVLQITLDNTYVLTTIHAATAPTEIYVDPTTVITIKPYVVDERNGG